MKRDPVRASVLATKIIPNVAPDMAKELGLLPGEKSLALVTSDCDDVTYTALDEATKKADCRVAYAKSFYAGAANANTSPVPPGCTDTPRRLRPKPQQGDSKEVLSFS